MFGIRVTLLGVVAVAVLIRDSDAGKYATPAEATRIYELTTSSLFVSIDELWRTKFTMPINASKKYEACFNRLRQKTYAGLENCAKNVFNEIAPTIKYFLSEGQIKWIMDQYKADMVRYEREFTHSVFGTPLKRPFEQALANVNRVLEPVGAVYGELMQS